MRYTSRGYWYGPAFNPRGDRRNPTSIICFHHSVSENNRPEDHLAESIVDFHMMPEAQGGRGWQSGGYNDVIEQDGTLVQLISTLAHGAHLGKLNSRAHGVCIVGDGRRPGFFTAAQQAKAAARVTELLAMPEYAGAEIGGHRDYNDRSGAPSECPAFDFRAWWGRQQNLPPPAEQIAELMGRVLELESMIERLARDFQGYIAKWSG